MRERRGMTRGDYEIVAAIAIGAAAASAVAWIAVRVMG